MCKYVFTCIFCARGNEGPEHLARKGFLVSFLFFFLHVPFHRVAADGTLLSPIMIV